MSLRTGLPARLKSFHGRAERGEATAGANSRNSSPAPRGATIAQHGASLSLRTRIIKARNLAPKDKRGTSDPYLVLTLGEAKQATVVVPKSLNPEWNETIELPVTGLHSLLLEVVCWDKDRFSKDYMGEFDIALEDIFADGAVADEARWYPLQSRKTGKKKSVASGEVLLELSLYDPLHTSATSQHIYQKLMGITAGSSDLEDEEDESSPVRVNSGDIDEVGSSSSEETPEDVKNDNPEKRKRRHRLARLRKKAKQRAYEFSGLSDLDGVLFLEISRINDLPPERNALRTSFDMDPFVVTSLGKKTYKTKVVRHNLNPVYDEKLVFQVARHETNYTVNFAVVDRDKLSGNDFIATTNFLLDNVTSIAPEADPATGLYNIRDPTAMAPNFAEHRKSRLRKAMSRSSSSTSLQRLNSRSNMKQTSSQLNLAGLSHTLSNETPNPAGNGSQAQDHFGMPEINHHESNTQDDPDLKPFSLPLTLQIKDRWEEKHKPVLHIKAKYLPYKALRQQFWRAMLKQYDADDSGHVSKVELTTMLDTLGSTLHQSTINGFFKRFNNVNTNGEPALTFDQAVMCLEDLLQMFEDQQKSLRYRVGSAAGLATSTTVAKHPSRPTSPFGRTTSTLLSRNQSSASLVPALNHEFHGKEGEEGETLDGDDLAGEEGEEEHVVEIRECPICHQPRMTKKSDADIITHIATCASQDWRQVNNIVMAGFVTSSQARRKWYSKVITKIGYGGYKLGANSANILVQDRMTGQINEERMSVYVRLGIRLLYKGLKSRDMEKKRIRKLLRSLSFKQGRKYDDPASAAEIQSFINFHRLDMSEVLLSRDQFKTFNDFFYRKLKADARPCSAPDRPEIVTSPADCRCVVFNRMEEAQNIWVKGREFSVERLLGKAYPEDAKRYANGALGVFRLAPQDYHRFHIPVDGIMGEPKLIDGEYYTVNPMAIRSSLDVYGENIRVVVPIDSKVHGRVMVICVGAMMVGSTVITRNKEDQVARAEELGYFKFGGSTILLLFEPGIMWFDDDLIDNSRSAIETLVRVGMSIGHSPGTEPHRPDMQKEAEDITQAEKQEAQRRIEGSQGPESSKFGSAAQIAQFK